MIGLPPSFLGLVQLMVIKSSAVSTALGVPGGPGGSVMKGKWKIFLVPTFFSSVFSSRFKVNYFRATSVVHTKRMFCSDWITGYGWITCSILIFRHDLELIFFSNGQISHPDLSPTNVTADLGPGCGSYLTPLYHVISNLAATIVSWRLPFESQRVAFDIFAFQIFRWRRSI